MSQITSHTDILYPPLLHGITYGHTIPTVVARYHIRTYYTHRCCTASHTDIIYPPLLHGITYGPTIPTVVARHHIRTYYIHRCCTASHTDKLYPPLLHGITYGHTIPTVVVSQVVHVFVTLLSRRRVCPSTIMCYICLTCVKLVVN